VPSRCRCGQRQTDWSTTSGGSRSETRSISSVTRTASWCTCVPPTARRGRRDLAAACDCSRHDDARRESPVGNRRQRHVRACPHRPDADAVRAPRCSMSTTWALADGLRRLVPPGDKQGGGFADTRAQLNNRWATAGGTSSTVSTVGTTNRT